MSEVMGHKDPVSFIGLAASGLMGPEPSSQCITPLHVCGVSAAHQQEVECMYVASGTCHTSAMTVSGRPCCAVNLN
jgi:hypothetical protein